MKTIARNEPKDAGGARKRGGGPTLQTGRAVPATPDTIATRYPTAASVPASPTARVRRKARYH